MVTNKTEPSQRRFQFTLRTLLVAVTLVAVACAMAKCLGAAALVAILCVLPAVVLVVFTRATSGEYVSGTVIAVVPFGIVGLQIFAVDILGRLDSREPTEAALAVCFLAAFATAGALVGGSLEAIHHGQMRIGMTTLIFALIVLAVLFIPALL